MAVGGFFLIFEAVSRPNDAPHRPKEVTVVKTVLVDSIDLVGCKVLAKVVDRWVH